MSEYREMHEPRAEPYRALPEPLLAPTPQSARDWRDLHNSLSLKELRQLSVAAIPQADCSLPFTPLTYNAPLYPEALRTQKAYPPILWSRGSTDLLCREAIGLCGSRDVSAQGLGAAADLGRKAADLDVVLVTGLARGVDREATHAVLDAGGSAIGVLAEGWEGWTKREFERQIETGRLLLLSEFRPSSRWRVGQAMQRNTTIVLLSKVMFLIEAGERGGTLDAGRRALRLRRPLFVLDTGQQRAGNEALIREGGKPPPLPLDIKSLLR